MYFLGKMVGKLTINRAILLCINIMLGKCNSLTYGEKKKVGKYIKKKECSSCGPKCNMSNKKETVC